MRWLLRLLFGEEWLVLRSEGREAKREAEENDAFAEEVVAAVCAIPIENWTIEGKGATAHLAATTRGGAPVILHCHTDWDGAVLFSLNVDGEPIQFSDERKDREAATRFQTLSDAVLSRHAEADAAQRAALGQPPTEAKRDDIRRRL